jgi:hypothetical protein
VLALYNGIHFGHLDGGGGGRNVSFQFYRVNELMQACLCYQQNHNYGFEIFCCMSVKKILIPFSNVVPYFIIQEAVYI